MPTGLSLHIGLNEIDPAYYGDDGRLNGCINDANDMEAIARGLGYQTTKLIDHAATKCAVVEQMGKAALALSSGDIFLISYSGHGSQVDDVDSEEVDAKDETWCLYDQMLIDDELRQIWSQFKAGVRIFMLSDSCHSGTVARMMVRRKSITIDPDEAEFMARQRSTAEPRFRVLSPQLRSYVQSDHGDALAAAQWISGGGRATIGATVILISGCQDNQFSLDGDANGLFTEKLKEIWNNGGFSGGYRAFHNAIGALMPQEQTPNFDLVGVANAAFEAEKPFTIGERVAVAGAGAAPAAGSGRPVIIAPPTLTRGGPAPVFSVNPGAGKAYALQVATEARFLYAIDGRRTKVNYWSTIAARPLGFSSSYPTDIALPDDVWQGLSAAGERLYYRLWRSDSRDAMTNQLSSAPNAATAPFVTIDGARSMRTRGGATITAPAELADEPAAPVFEIGTGGAPYFAVEVATRPELFGPARTERTSVNWFASYRGTTTLLAADGAIQEYVLPQAAWDQLRTAADILYYRLQTSTVDDGFENRTCTTPDARYAEAPALRIIRAPVMRQASVSGPTRGRTKIGTAL